jgi:hypothetical protein
MLVTGVEVVAMFDNCRCALAVHPAVSLVTPFWHVIYQQQVSVLTRVSIHMAVVSTRSHCWRYHL